MNLRSVVISAVVVFAGAAPAAAMAAPATVAKAPVKITVTAKEFSFHFSKTSVPVGSTVIFTVQNKGHVQHNLKFTTLHKGTPNIQPGKKATLKVVFKKAGRFSYECTVPFHAQQGMEGEFVVKK